MGHEALHEVSAKTWKLQVRYVMHVVLLHQVQWLPLFCLSLVAYKWYQLHWRLWNGTTYLIHIKDDILSIRTLFSTGRNEGTSMMNNCVYLRYVSTGCWVCDLHAVGVGPLWWLRFSFDEDQFGATCLMFQSDCPMTQQYISAPAVNDFSGLYPRKFACLSISLCILDPAWAHLHVDLSFQ